MAKPRTTDRLYSYTQLVQGGWLPCIIEIEPVGFFQPGKVINALDCRLISIRFWDPTKPGERIEIHEDLSDLVWPDPKIAIDKQATPKPGGGGGAAAAPLPEEADGPSIPLIAGTVAVGALILGGIAWTIRRSNSRADRRAGAKRDRDDDRPRKRSRRSS